MGKKIKCEWITVIPLMFWVCCILGGIGRLWQSEDGLTVLGVINEINCNTYATYVSMVICMTYYYFSAKGGRREEKSGLAREYMPITIIASIVYSVFYIINACRYCEETTIILLVVSVVYVVLYFMYMRKNDIKVM